MPLYSTRKLAEAFAVARAIGEIDNDPDDNTFYQAATQSGANIVLVLHARELLRHGASRRQVEDVLEGRIGIRAAVNRMKQLAAKPSATVMQFPAPVLH
jgi:hypothetical protein